MVITKVLQFGGVSRQLRSSFNNAVSFLPWRLIWVCVVFFFTFHDVDQRAHVAFLDDAAVFSILHRIHAVHDLLDLRQLQVLHEVIVQDGLLDQILGPAGQDERKSSVCTGEMRGDLAWFLTVSHWMGPLAEFESSTAAFDCSSWMNEVNNMYQG